MIVETAKMCFFLPVVLVEFSHLGWETNGSLDFFLLKNCSLLFWCNSPCIISNSLTKRHASVSVFCQSTTIVS